MVGMLTDGVLMTQAYGNGQCTAPANADTSESLPAPAPWWWQGRGQLGLAGPAARELPPCSSRCARHGCLVRRWACRRAAAHPAQQQAAVRCLRPKSDKKCAPPARARLVGRPP
jgi:hypothetical protein